jgi:hypothetical protein
LKAEHAVPAEAVSVFVTGAVASGRSHARSDLDVYVIAGRLDPVKPTDCVFRGVDGEPIPFLVRYVADGYRLDVEYWRETQVEHVFRRVSERPLDGTRMIGLNLTEDDLDFLSDIWIGKALAGEEWLLARQEALRAARLNLLVASRRFSQADSSIEDALGLLETGDQSTALLAAGIAFTFVVDGLVAAEGELSPNPKWRAEKVRCAQSNALSWDEYWDLETRRHLDPAQPEPWIRHVLARCQELMLSLDFE